MKILTIIIIIVAMVWACSPAPKVYSPQISNINRTEEGTIYVKCTGMGKNKEAAYENAIYNAFSTVLYQGVPESVQSRPLVEPANTQAARSKLEKCITSNECYRNFITQITSSGSYTKVDGGYATVASIKINMTALRSYLEQNNIIRKFGL